MSKGSNRITVRVPQQLLDSMQSWIEAFNSDPNCQTEITQSDFILTAIAERLAKIGRGRKKKGGVKVHPAEPGFRREMVDTFEASIWGD